MPSLPSMKIHHLNCGILHAPPNPKASCHCLLIELEGWLVLVDTGIGLQDIKHPVERIGQFAIDAAGFQFHEEHTAARQVERLGFQIADVTDILLTHADQDHAGGLADFPAAKVHVAAEEFAQIESGNGRYSAAQFAHGPRWVAHGVSSERWFGLEARRMALVQGGEIYLVPLFGHTLGHCGVAVQVGERWLLHVGDAYYLKVELLTDDHPVSALAAMRAEDDGLRRASLAELRRLVKVDLVGYHDFSEFPTGA
jgi:glyoxylase-like metal-dependent hydrolase (beta-lactamase superfamily II)